MDLETLSAWQRIIRDFVIVAIGAFLMIHEAYADAPNPYLIGAALTALGLPPVLRLDRGREENSERDKRQ